MHDDGHQEPQSCDSGEQQLGAHGWSCIGWPSQWGGRDATLAEQVRKHARQVVKTLFLPIGAVARLGIFAIIVALRAFLSRGVDLAQTAPLLAAKAESCEVCRSYRKLYRLDKQQYADPVADDLASLALDILVGEAGYARAGHNPFLLLTE